MKKFLIAVDHLADYNGNGYEYFVLEADNLTEAKNRTLVNFHKFKKTYLIKILQTTKDRNQFRPICNIYGDGWVETAKDDLSSWYVCLNATHDFETYITSNTFKNYVNLQNEAKVIKRKQDEKALKTFSK